MKDKVIQINQTRSRGEQLEAAGATVEMPPLDAAGHLVDVLWQVGPTVHTGMGAAPITFGELQAWQQQTGYELGAWEAKTLRRMSVAYCSQAEQSRNRDCPAPWLSDSARRGQAGKAKKIRSVLRD